MDWELLITEIRYDADSEPNGEFIEIYNDFSFGFSSYWQWKGREHGKPHSGDHGEDFIVYQYGWFRFSRPADIYDWVMHYDKIGKLDQFLRYHRCDNIWIYIEKNLEWIHQRKLKKLIKKFDPKSEHTFSHSFE